MYIRTSSLAPKGVSQKGYHLGAYVDNPNNKHDNNNNNSDNITTTTNKIIIILILI